MQIMIGGVQTIQDLAALFYVVGGEKTFSLDIPTRGWMQLIFGALLATSGFLLFTGAVWARVIGIGGIAISAVLHVMWLPPVVGHRAGRRRHLGADRPERDIAG